MKSTKIFTFLSFLLFFTTAAFSQAKCCAKGSKEAIACNAKATKAVACCATTNAKETTSGCTPSNCRGAKTKFGEAKVISELRLQLVALKAKMESHNLNFSEQSISVHDIIGESDQESLEIVAEHLGMMEMEILSQTDNNLPVVEWSERKALKVKQLNDRITELSNLL